MGRGHLLSVPSVRCSPSHWPLHRWAGAARLGCLSFPTGPGPGGPRTPAGQTRWVTGAGRCRGPEELRRAGRCRGARPGAEPWGQLSPAKPPLINFHGLSHLNPSGTRAAPARGPLAAEAEGPGSSGSSSLSSGGSSARYRRWVRERRGRLIAPPAPPAPGGPALRRPDKGQVGALGLSRGAKMQRGYPWSVRKVLLSYSGLSIASCTCLHIYTY